MNLLRQLLQAMFIACIVHASSADQFDCSALGDQCTECVSECDFFCDTVEGALNGVIKIIKWPFCRVCVALNCFITCSGVAADQRPCCSMQGKNCCILGETQFCNSNANFCRENNFPGFPDDCELPPASECDDLCEERSKTCVAGGGQVIPTGCFVCLKGGTGKYSCDACKEPNLLTACEGGKSYNEIICQRNGGFCFIQGCGDFAYTCG